MWHMFMRHLSMCSTDLFSVNVTWILLWTASDLEEALIVERPANTQLYGLYSKQISAMLCKSLGRLAEVIQNFRCKNFLPHWSIVVEWSVFEDFCVS